MVELVPSELYGPRVVSPGRETDTTEAKTLEGPLCSGDVVTATMGAKRENKTKGHLPWPLLPPHFSHRATGHRYNAGAV